MVLNIFRIPFSCKYVCINVHINLQTVGSYSWKSDAVLCSLPSDHLSFGFEIFKYILNMIVKVICGVHQWLWVWVIEFIRKMQTFGWTPAEAKMHMVNDYFTQSEVWSWWLLVFLQDEFLVALTICALVEIAVEFNCWDPRAKSTSPFWGLCTQA